MIEETLQTFADQDPPPSRLRAEGVLARARRRTRRRIALTSTVAGTATALAVLGSVAAVHARSAPRPAVAGVGCVVEELKVPASVAGWTMVTGIDPSGRYVIGRAGSRDASVAIRWTDGAPDVLASGFTPVSVNTAGVVAGFTEPVSHDHRKQRPAAYIATGLVTLPLPSGAVGGDAYSVNARGDVLGSANLADGSSAAVLWHTAGSIAITATMAGNGFGEAVTDDGVLVGFTQDTRPVRWALDGTGTAMPLPPGADSATVLSAGGDWATGVLAEVGKGDPAPADVVSLRWNLKTGSVERLAGFTARTVSASGTVAGLSATNRPAYWRNGRVTILPGPTSGARQGSIGGITADGQTIAGNALVPNNPTPMSTDSPARDATNGSPPVIWRGC